VKRFVFKAKCFSLISLRRYTYAAVRTVSYRNISLLREMNLIVICGGIRTCCECSGWQF